MTWIFLLVGGNDMLLFVNDLSIHGQFQDIPSFKKAILYIMTLRKTAKQFGRTLYCHRKIASARVTHDLSMFHAIQYFSKDEKRSVMQWLTKNGPFWEDNHGHSPDEYIECKGFVVTETGIGEAAYHIFFKEESGLISFIPSNWLYSPIHVTWFHDEESSSHMQVDNFWNKEQLLNKLKSSPLPLTSWKQLENTSIQRFYNLTFGDNAFLPLDGLPFVSSASYRLFFIFNTLSQIKDCFDSKGSRTSEGHEIYQKFFTGKKGKGGSGAIFKDSSDSEKISFKDQLTFRHPDKPGEKLFCPWHGTVQTPQLRVHFSWPIRKEEPLYYTLFTLDPK